MKHMKDTYYLDGEYKYLYPSLLFLLYIKTKCKLLWVGYSVQVLNDKVAVSITYIW